MTKPDWSKAPEGASHFGEATGDWYKIGKGFYLWVETKCWTPLLALPSEKLIEMRPQWRGPEDGLPPVGTVCEYLVGESMWEEVTVVHRGRCSWRDCAVIQGANSITVEHFPSSFRPIKTQEQRELDQLYADIDEAFATNATLSDFLYAKGYRKP
jgi:hypothetical protein